MYCVRLCGNLFPVSLLYGHRVCQPVQCAVKVCLIIALFQSDVSLELFCNLANLPELLCLVVNPFGEVCGKISPQLVVKGRNVGVSANLDFPQHTLHLVVPCRNVRNVRRSVHPKKEFLLSQLLFQSVCPCFAFSANPE
ncbi:unknown [Firmicutes bacterium CAG:102]|nr:unknown [Firmicutes bacterium CAG:102]